MRGRGQPRHSSARTHQGPLVPSGQSPHLHLRGPASSCNPPVPHQPRFHRATWTPAPAVKRPRLHLNYLKMVLLIYEQLPPASEPRVQGRARDPSHSRGSPPPRLGTPGLPRGCRLGPWRLPPAAHGGPVPAYSHYRPAAASVGPGEAGWSSGSHGRRLPSCRLGFP